MPLGEYAICVWNERERAAQFIMQHLYSCNSFDGAEAANGHQVCLWFGWAQNTYFISFYLFSVSWQRTNLDPHTFETFVSYEVHAACTEMSYSWILLKVSKRRCEWQRSWQSGERAAVCGHAIAQHKTNEFVHDLKLLISRSNWSVRVECGCLPSSRFIVLRFTIYCFFFPFLFMVQSWAEQHLICIEWWTGNANASKLSKPLYKRHRDSHRDVVRRHWLAGLVALRSPL